MSVCKNRRGDWKPLSQHVGRLILESVSGKVLLCNRQAAAMVGMDWEDAGKIVAEILRLLLNSAEDPEQTFNHYRTALTADDDYSFDPHARNGRRTSPGICASTASASPMLAANCFGRGQVAGHHPRPRTDRMKSALSPPYRTNCARRWRPSAATPALCFAPDVHWDEASQHEFCRPSATKPRPAGRARQNLLDMSRISRFALKSSANCIRSTTSCRKLAGFAPDVRASAAGDGRRFAAGAARRRASAPPPAIWSRTRSNITGRRAIELQTRRANGSVQFAVRDYGSGIPPGRETQIFERFYRLDDTLTRAYRRRRSRTGDLQRLRRSARRQHVAARRKSRHDIRLFLPIKLPEN